METAIQVNEMAENEYAGEVPPSNPDRLINWIIKRQGEISSFSIFEQVDARLPSLTSMSDLLDGYISHLESIKSESVIVEIPIPDESYHTTPEDYRSAYVASGFTKPDNFVFNNNDREKAQARLLKVNYQSTKLYNGSTYNNDGRRHSSNNVIASFEKGSDEEIAILFESKYKEEYKERILEINSKINKLSNGSWIQRLANQGRIRSEKLNLEVESRKLERGEKLSNEFNRKYHGYNIIDISTVQIEMNSLKSLSASIKAMSSIINETEYESNFEDRSHRESRRNKPKQSKTFHAENQIDKLNISDEYKEIIQDFSDYIENYGINIQFKENDSLDGIKRSCKNAFRRFAFRYHPDTSPINDKARNQEIFKGVGNYYVEIDKMK